MGMHDAAQLGEGAIEYQMSRGIWWRIEITLYDLTRCQVYYDHIVCCHRAVIDTRWLDNNEFFLSVDATYIAPSKEHQIVPYKIQVGLTYFFFQFF